MELPQEIAWVEVAGAVTTVLLVTALGFSRPNSPVKSSQLPKVASALLELAPGLQFSDWTAAFEAAERTPSPLKEDAIRVALRNASSLRDANEIAANCRGDICKAFARWNARVERSQRVQQLLTETSELRCRRAAWFSGRNELTLICDGTTEVAAPGALGSNTAKPAVASKPQD